MKDLKEIYAVQMIHSRSAIDSDNHIALNKDSIDCVHFVYNSICIELSVDICSKLNFHSNVNILQFIVVQF